MNHLHFLEPTALASLGLLAAVIVLYVLRMPRTRLALASLSFLRPLQLDARRQSRRLRTFLSMLLQLLILALLALSAARPLLSSGQLLERRILLVLDVSASMGTRDGKDGLTRFEEARTRARDIVRRMEHGDHMLILTADREARIVQQFEKDRRTLYRTLDALQPGFQSTDLSQAFDLVREVIRPLAEPEVYLLSDGACRIDADRYRDVLARTRFLPVGQASRNIGFVSFSARRNMDSERDFSSLISLLNTWDEPVRVALKLTIGAKTVDVRELSLPPQQTFTEMYEKTLLVGGGFQAEVTLLEAARRDFFAADQVAYEWIPKSERVKVLVVAESDELGSYLDAAMSAHIGVQGYRITPQQYSTRYDVEAMVFYNWIPPELPPCHLVFVNSRGRNPAAEIASAAVLRPVMRSWDRTHPLMNYIGLENLLVAQALQVKELGGMETVARTVQTPLILAGRRGAQKIVFVGFDPKQSDFPFRLAFPVLLSNSLLWFTQEDAATQRTQFRPGEVVDLRMPASVTDPPADLSVFDPLQNESRVKVVAGFAPYTQASLCGVYTYGIGGRDYGFAVNLADAEESDIRPRPEFLQALASDAKAAETQAPVLERELWFLLNWIGLVLLCAEAYLYHQRILF
ncbi:MAG: VWA domain-containing protein [Planctomycetes bacterium]|nr:VWA domain-containing protein [Planctomycetota bacterium]